MHNAVRAKLQTLPASPGVYLFKGARGTYLYVGKAASLRSRVRSYFQASNSDSRAFIGRLEREVQDVDTIVTASEKEAALLENSLIKEHRPRYNFKLRDDKDFLSLRLDPARAWPRLEVVRRPGRDGAQYFGPYPSASAARSTLRTVNRHFQLRTCTDSDFRARVRPCLQYQIKRCSAPCVLDADADAYQQQVRNVGMFLDGRHDELVGHLDAQMKRASRAMRYETAATYRDQLRAVESIRERQRVALVSDRDQDVFGLFRAERQAELAVLQVRRGKVVAVRTYGQQHAELPDDELLGSFVSEYYARGSRVPDEVLLPVRVEADRGLAELLSERRASKVRLHVPKRGLKARLLRMAMDNAAHAYSEKARAQSELSRRLERIQSRLGLPKPPQRIECVDVSHTGGSDTVAAITRLDGGKPAREGYRTFHLKQASGGDDYGAMHEVLSRRLARGREQQRGWELPDLLVVDGGRGQLAIAARVLKELGIGAVSLAALAKERTDAQGRSVVERVYLPGRKNAIALRPGDEPLALLALARDEAHRVCNLHRVKLGNKRKLRSRLQEIAGIGDKTRRRLLRRLGSLQAIERATLEQLLEAGANKRQAEALLRAVRAHSAAQPSAAPEPPDPEPDSEGAEKQAVDNAFEPADAACEPVDNAPE